MTRIAILIAAISIAVAGCVGSQRREQIAEAQQGLAAAKAECQARNFPTHVEKAQCLGNAERQYHLPFASQPDLIQRKIALRNALAAKVDARQMSLADAQLELANEDSRAASERLARGNAQRAVAAQERSAAAASAGSAPITCVGGNAIVTCF